ncbi:hypothetical protein QQF64_034596 [Cirrhinus molitorella]|uniref:Peptidase A2 domain-containing protein n=1 Tax=Cirrhinus molitorella TaxID=172907 RepID=A0ABR3L3G8_9TELE
MTGEATNPNVSCDTKSLHEDGLDFLSSQTVNHWVNNRKEAEHIVSASVYSEEGDENSDVKVVNEEHEDSFFLGAITVKDSNGSWSVTLRIQDSNVEFKIDTGADISVISEQTYEALNRKPDLMLASEVLDCPGQKLISTGRFETSTHYKGNEYCFTVFIITGQSVNNLSREVSAALGLIQWIDDVTNAPSVSAGLLKIIPVRIKLKSDAVPYAVTTARRVSVPLLPKVKAELERMVWCSVIEEITEPMHQWCLYPGRVDKLGYVLA